MRYLFRALHGEVQRLAANDARAAPLVESELRANALGMRRDEPRHTPLARHLLVRRRGEDHIALECDLPGVDAPLEEEHRHEVRGEHAFVVDRTAPVEEAVTH